MLSPVITRRVGQGMMISGGIAAVAAATTAVTPLVGLLAFLEVAAGVIVIIGTVLINAPTTSPFFCFFVFGAVFSLPIFALMHITERLIVGPPFTVLLLYLCAGVLAVWGLFVIVKTY